MKTVIPCFARYLCRAGAALATAASGAAALFAALTATPPAARAAGDAVPTVDVLVVYTAAARDYLGGEDGVRAEINAMVEETNEAFERSGVNGAVRLAADAATGDTAAGARLATNALGAAYTESTVSFEDDLVALSDWRAPRGSSTMVISPDDALPDVHQWRNDTRADLVVLLRHGTVANTAGIAWTLDSADGAPAGGFAVVGARLNTYTFPHELGHTLGLLHDRANSSGAVGAFDYAYGYLFTGESGAEHGTIMSYAQGEARIGYFSTPLLEFDGAPLGREEGATTTTTDSRGRVTTAADSADCARALNQTIPVVARYREPSLPAPLITTPAGRYNGQVAVVLDVPDGAFGVVRYTTDGSAVTVSSPAASTGTVLLSPADSAATQTFRVRARLFTDDAESGATSLHGPEASAAYTVVGASACRAATGARLAAGNAHSLLIDAANATYAAGDNALGQSGAGASAADTGGAPLLLDDGTDGNPAETVSAYADHTAVVAANNGLLLFGSNARGQLGTGNTTNARGGVADSSSYSGSNGARGNENYIASFRNVLAAVAGGSHTVLLDLAGQLYAAGANDRGQLGDATTTDRREFTAVNYAAAGGEDSGAPVNDAVRLAAGATHTLFINAAGDLYGFGDNASGQLGRDPGAASFSAVPVKIAANAAAAAASDANTYYIDGDGALHALGANDCGQLGAAGEGASAAGASGAFSTTPVRVATGVAQVAAGHKHALFITVAGDLYGFGDNSAGQLGLDPETTPFSATPLLLATNVAAAAGGASHTLYAQAAGGGSVVGEGGEGAETAYAVFALGSNAAGQLGAAVPATVVTAPAATGISYAPQAVVGGGGDNGDGGNDDATGGGDEPLAPIITRQPEDASAREGETVVFRVSAVNGDGDIAAGALAYAWLRNGEALADDAGGGVAGAGTAALTLSRVLPASAGSYQCEVTDTATGVSVISEPASLTVTGYDFYGLATKGVRLVAPKFDKTASPLARGTKQTFHWTADFGDGAGERTLASASGKPVSGSTFTVKGGADGHYRVYFRHTPAATGVEVLELARDFGWVQVFPKLAFDKVDGLRLTGCVTPVAGVRNGVVIAPDAEVPEVIALTAKLAAPPEVPVVFRWFDGAYEKGKSPLPGGVSAPTFAQSDTFSFVPSANSKIWCVASVAAGDGTPLVDAAGKPFAAARSKTFAVRAVLPPAVEITTPTAKLTVAAGGTITLKTRITGTGKFACQWFKDGEPINPVANATAAKATLVVKRPAAGDAGVYAVVVTNPAGTAYAATASATVSVTAQ